jgi:hypothetical protein
MAHAATEAARGAEGAPATLLPSNSIKSPEFLKFFAIDIVEGLNYEVENDGFVTFDQKRLLRPC